MYIYVLFDMSSSCRHPPLVDEYDDVDVDDLGTDLWIVNENHDLSKLDKTGLSSHGDLQILITSNTIRNSFYWNYVLFL